MKKIGILGGSFNPVHNGHLSVANTVLNLMYIDEVWFMPNGNPAYKSNLVSAKHRMNMIDIATSHMKDVFVSDMEVSRDGYTYTYDTAVELGYLEDEFYFIIGADSFYNLGSWYRADELLNIANFIVINREQSDEILRQDVKEYDKIYSGKFKYVHMEEVDVSSSEIRKLVANGENISGYVPKKVAKYIEKWKLYR